MLNIKFMKKYIFLLFILVTIAGQNYAQDANEPSGSSPFWSSLE